jgi:hypothetical protein
MVLPIDFCWASFGAASLESTGFHTTARFARSLYAEGFDTPGCQPSLATRQLFAGRTVAIRLAEGIWKVVATYVSPGNSYPPLMAIKEHLSRRGYRAQEIQRSQRIYIKPFST